MSRITADRVYWRTFTVTGKRPFPVVMLQKDHCQPATEHDAHQITHSLTDPHSGHEWEVRLIQWVYETTYQPTVARWQSHQWKVTDIGTPSGHWPYVNPSGNEHWYQGRNAENLS